MGTTRPWLLCLALLAQTHALTRPPGIYNKPLYNVFYKAGETVEMRCRAEGFPPPTYTWKRNGKDFNPGGNDDRVVQLEEVGTLIITKPEDKDEGIFQCFATNEYGTSLSIRINLREGKLKEFELEPDTIKTPTLGSSLTLPCVPPESIPPAHVYWVIKSPNGNFEAVNYDARVTMDIEYRLRFTNVKKEDHVEGRAYACVASNPFMRRLSQGPLFFVNPLGDSETQYSVKYMWASPQDHFGLLGNNLTVKCIFSGNPTPDVHWERTDGYPMTDRAKIQSFGQALMIQNLQYDDAGTYECWATNTITQTRIQRTVDIRVESRPYWLLEPQDVEVGVGGEAVFDCLAKAEPAPQYFWFINGVPLDKVKDTRITPERFRRPRPDRVAFSGLNREDSMVIQCNATNKHGYIWGDVFLNVLSEPPTIIKPPPMQTVVAEGTSVNVSCEVTGKPDPIVTWFKDTQQITGGRYRIQPKGGLSIQHVVLSDAGKYVCQAENVHNHTSSSGLLLVRRKTRIERIPKDLEVTAGTDAKFTCSGTTDPEEAGNLRVQWLKDHKAIVSDVVQRMTTNRQDNSLTISGTIVRDSGSYTCIVTNGLDSASASAMLTVRSKPDAVSKVKIKKCERGIAILDWMPGPYNNAPVQYFVVQYNTSFNPDTWNFATKVDSIFTTANVSLSPWGNYTFRVIAYNKLGQSDPSFPTSTVCHTDPSVPDFNPRNLRAIGDRKGQLHLEWTPMPKQEQNGEGFGYELQLYKEGYPNDVTTKRIHDWKVSEYYHATGSDVYQPYIITLQAQNTVGPAGQDLVPLRGFTGEDAPQVGVQNLAADTIGDTYAILVWAMDYTQIASNHTALNGEFRGFKIQCWWRGDKAGTLREWDIRPEDALATRVGNTFSARVDHLLPNTDLSATVAVMNNFYVSRPSDTFDFTTRPGLPGPVELFRPINIGDNHANLEWKPPIENRGAIIGYDIGYQSVKGLDLGEVQERDPQINDPYATTAMLSGLLTSSKYRVHIWARTVAGRGEGYFIELDTTEAGDPKAPRFTITDVGQHNINVSWWINPYAVSGTIVFIEYRKEDAAEWQETTDEVVSSYQNIKNLEAGTTYEIRLVATNGGVTTRSHVEDVTTDGLALASALVGNYGWFVGMLLALLTMIGLIIFFVIIFKRGHRFRQNTDSPTDSTYDGGTEKYTDTDRIPRRSSEFRPEPRGFHNQYYDDRDFDYYRNRDDDGKEYDDDHKREYDKKHTEAYSHHQSRSDRARDEKRGEYGTGDSRQPDYDYRGRDYDYDDDREYRHRGSYHDRDYGDDEDRWDDDRRGSYDRHGSYDQHGSYDRRYLDDDDQGYGRGENYRHDYDYSLDQDAHGSYQGNPQPKKARGGDHSYEEYEASPPSAKFHVGAPDSHGYQDPPSRSGRQAAGDEGIKFPKGKVSARSSHV